MPEKYVPFWYLVNLAEEGCKLALNRVLTYIGYAWQAVHCILCQNLNSAMDRHLSTANKIVLVYTMVADRGSRIIALFILNVSISCRRVVRLYLGFYNPREKIPGICWVGVGGSVESVWAFWRRENSVTPARN